MPPSRIVSSTANAPVTPVDPLNPSITGLFSPSLSMFAELLTPAAAVAAALGLWRLGADPGWTNEFFIADGLLSHWQAWFAVGIGAHTSGRSLNRWLKIQNAGQNNSAGREDANHRRRHALTLGVARW